MNNLTTRKIVLGLLMTLVLAFSVQGTADALTDPNISTNPSEFSVLNPGARITISGLNVRRNDTTQRESLTLAVTGGGADFPHPVITGTRVSSYTWLETDDRTAPQGQVLDPPTDHNNGSLSIPSSVTITVGAASDASEIEVTVTWTRESGDAAGGTGMVVRRFYAVDPVTAATEISITDGGVNGFVIKAGGAQAIDFTATPAHIPVTFSSSSGNLFVRRIDSGVTREGTRGRTLNTSSFLSTNTANVMLDLTGTSTVTISHPSENPDSVVYIRGRPTVTITDGNNQSGIVNGRLEEALSVRVTDSRGSNVAGIPVQFSFVTTGNSITTNMDNQFIPVSGTTVYVAPAGTLVTALANDTRTIEATSFHPSAADANVGMFVQTDSAGVAKVYLKLGTADDNVSTVDVTRVNATVSDGTNSVSLLSSFRQEIRGSQRIPTIEIVSGNSQRADADGNIDNPLVVVVKNRGQRISGERVTFTTAKGYLEAEADGFTGNRGAGVNQIPGPAKSVTYWTNSSGEAEVDFFLGSDTGVVEVVASISGTTPVGSIPYGDTVTFTVNGTPSSGGGGGGGGGGGSDPTNTITISPSSTTGDPGETETISVSSSPTGVLVTLSSTEFANTLFSPQSGLTPFTSTLTLPSSTRSYSFFAFGSIGGATVSDSATVTVATTAPGSLTIEALGAPANGSQAVRVTVRESDGTLKSDDLSVTLTGPGISRSVETVGGTGAAAVTVPTATTSYTLTASATGYTSGQITLSATTGQTGGSTPPPAGPVGVADSIEIDGSRQLSGTVDQAMRLRVRVLDANDNGVSDVRVTFRVLAPGRGTFAGARGNGRAVADQTDRNGYASANLTPSDDGDIIVRASAAGVSADVTFIIDVGEASADTETPTPSRDVTPSRDISPVVHVGVASRPPMLWVDGGAIYALVGASAQKFAPSVDNALNITVADGKVYWTEMTGESGGTINSANLDGTGVTELASIFATPIGIAVDTDGSKLYWTNSSGRIQSANLDGSRITNELQDLPSPMDLALGNGNVYWTQGNGSVRFVNLRGQRIVRDISTGSDTPGSLVIGGGKVYWTEKTGDSSGTVNSANLNGTGATQLASIRAVPMGIAVDGARSKLYWSNSRGRIQSADLDGSGITNVVSGLGSPGDMVLSNSIAAPAATPTPTTTPTASKYDVNSDGSVDNTDAGLVADAMGTSNARYDVNGDGTVNFLDLLLVFDNRDDNAAGAPTIVGMKLSAAQIDIIKEQIDLLIATNDRSPAAMRTLIYLQQLLVTARPEKTQLLANYPNPFNPETWIPYELATDTDVRITIYNTQGVVIRSLQLGHQSAGYYTGRDRAAYWDGRNALGEQVASGLYFYQLETDEMSLMRKMVILK